MSDRIIILAGIALLIAYGLAYWAMQPTCGAAEVRVRGFYMTACVKGH